MADQTYAEQLGARRLSPAEIRATAPQYKPTSRVYVIERPTPMAIKSGLEPGSVLSWRQIQQTAIRSQTGQKTTLENRARQNRREKAHPGHVGGALKRKAARGWKEKHGSSQSINEIMTKNKAFNKTWKEWKREAHPNTGRKFGWFIYQRGRWWYVG